MVCGGGGEGRGDTHLITTDLCRAVSQHFASESELEKQTLQNDEKEFVSFSEKS